MRAYPIIIYGSYGYTGKLITAVCKEKGISILLAGRNEEALNAQAIETNYPVEVVDINNSTSLTELLAKGQLVIHCAGPFQFTAKQMVEACLKTGTHYLDITGEYQVFEMLAQHDAQAKAAKILVMPGVGFDVVPSDCLAVYLKSKLPSATHLQLAFTGLRGGFSRGTAKTSIEGLGNGSTIREHGKLLSIPTASRVKTINFGTFTSMACCIPWGDISTAYRSSGIPNIEVYMGMPPKMISLLKWSTYIQGLFRLKVVKNFLKRQMEKRSAGPSEEKRKNSRSFLWGKVWDGAGNKAEARIETVDGYSLTALTSVLIAEKILEQGQAVECGYHTPAQYFGADLVLEIKTTTRVDVVTP